MPCLRCQRMFMLPPVMPHQGHQSQSLKTMGLGYIYTASTSHHKTVLKTVWDKLKNSLGFDYSFEFTQQLSNWSLLPCPVCLRNNTKACPLGPRLNRMCLCLWNESFNYIFSPALEGQWIRAVKWSNLNIDMMIDHFLKFVWCNVWS